MLLSCVFSATDTVAAVSIVKETKYPQMNSLLFGEGVMNDAAAILLFKTVYSLFENTDELEIGWSHLGTLSWSFSYLTFLSVLIGVGFGLLCAFIFKKVSGFQENPPRELTLIILIAYLSYTLAEILEISGIMTLFCCGVTLKRYVWFNISKKAK